MTHTASARAIRDRIASGEASATSICQAFLERISALNPRLYAFSQVAEEQALARAASLDAATGADRAELAKLPLLGVPIAIKEVIATRELRTTASSRILEHYHSPIDATVVSRLRAAGAIVLGKTNCDEFAMGSSNENSAFGPTRNPWALDRIPGGSSGGSAAAVAARLAPVALGTDTGGSIRQPAALCGIVGMKPTYGRVSRFGLLAFGSSLDQIGPMTTSVEDAALLLNAIAGPDPSDATSVKTPPPDFTSRLEAGAKGTRIGVPRALLGDGLDATVRDRLLEALSVLEREGATLVDIELPHARYAIPVYYLVATAEASSNLARYDGVRYTSRARLAAGDDLTAMYQRTRDEGFGDEVKRRIMLGTYVLSAGYYDAYYLKAQQVRTLIRRDYDRAFESVDAIAMPTSPTPAIKLGERVDDPLQMYLMDVFTVSANLTGLPGISVPCGFTASASSNAASDAADPNPNLPIGFQLIGRAFDEPALLQIARAYERASNWSEQLPPLD
jgi:aspartyl-tRNA(Asn)/glutamyl-tRNA(Gln) amidotransferase subunit A